MIFFQRSMRYFQGGRILMLDLTKIKWYQSSRYSKTFPMIPHFLYFPWRLILIPATLTFSLPFPAIHHNDLPSYFVASPPHVSSKNPIRSTIMLCDFFSLYFELGQSIISQPIPFLSSLSFISGIFNCSVFLTVEPLLIAATIQAPLCLDMCPTNST